jgi:hypothetical protein
MKFLSTALAQVQVLLTRRNNNTTTLTDDYVNKLKYRDLQRECVLRGLRATGSTAELRKRLLEFDPLAVVTSEAAASKPIVDTTTTNITEAEVNALKYNLLQRECKNRGLKATGLTAELRKRLLEFDPSVVSSKPAASKPAASKPIVDTTSTNITEAEVNALKYNLLRRECKNRGLKATGTTVDLRKRLLEIDPSVVSSNLIVDTTTTSMTEARDDALTAIGNFIIDANKVNIPVSISPFPML